MKQLLQKCSEASVRRVRLPSEELQLYDEEVMGSRGREVQQHLYMDAASILALLSLKSSQLYL